MFTNGKRKEKESRCQLTLMYMLGIEYIIFSMASWCVSAISAFHPLIATSYYIYMWLYIIVKINWKAVIAFKIAWSLHRFISHINFSTISTFHSFKICFFSIYHSLAHDKIYISLLQCHMQYAYNPDAWYQLCSTYMNEW